MHRGSSILVLLCCEPLSADAQLQVKEKMSVEFKAGAGGAFSPDAKVYVKTESGDELRVYDSATGKLLALRAASGHKRSTGAPIFSPDGMLLAFIGAEHTASDGFVSLWDTKTWKQSAILRVPAPYRLAFSPDSRTLAVQLWEGKANDLTGISVWEVKGVTGVRERAVLGPLVGGAQSTGKPVYSPDSKLLFTGYRFWNTNSEEFWVFPDGQKFPESASRGLRNVSFSPDSKLFFAGAEGIGYRFWDVKTGKEVATVKFEFGGRDGVERTPIFSPDGKVLAVQLTAQRFELIDVGTGQSLKTIEGSPHMFSKDGKSLIGFGKAGFTTWELTWQKEPAK